MSSDVSLIMAANYLGITSQLTVDNWLKSGNFPGSYQKDGIWYFNFEELKKVKNRIEELRLQNTISEIEISDPDETTLYHATIPKKVRLYHQSGKILSPVRGFTTLNAAMAWAMKTQRSVILKITGSSDKCHKLPDHHNSFGEAWWFDQDIESWKCIISPQKI